MTSGRICMSPLTDRGVASSGIVCPASRSRSVKRPSSQKAGSSGPSSVASDPSPPLRLRLRVQLHKGRLDQQVAEGLGPDPVEAEDLALRARQLAGMRVRRRLARSLRARVKDAERLPAPRLSAAVPLSRRVVLSWREGLLGLAERLERPEPVNPCGVARVVVLLTDAMGPLYEPGAAGPDERRGVVDRRRTRARLRARPRDRRPAGCSHLPVERARALHNICMPRPVSVWALDPSGGEDRAWTFYRYCSAW